MVSEVLHMNRFLSRAFVILSLFASATVVADGLTIEQVAQLRSVSQAVIAPQGGRIAYTLVVPRTPMSDEDGPVWTELHVTDTRGESRRFVGAPSRVSQLGWMPDGSMVTFLEKRSDDEQTALYGIPADGGEARRLATLPTAISGYDISPDGSRVALRAREPEPEARTERQSHGFTQRVHEEDWLHTGLWIMPLDGSSEPRRLPVEGTVHQVHWSPDGSRLALAVAPTPSVDDSYVFLRVRIVDAESGEVLARIENPGKLGDIAWSPDGEFLAMLSVADQHDPRDGRLVVVPASGGE
jgi:dipeptidyl aminopeptidase/acylaminoacyl peptidase